MNTQETQVKATLLNLLKNIAPDANFEALGETEDIRQALGIDSFDFLNFMIGINESFGVEIPETDYGKLMTLKDIIQYIEAHRT
ncbi:MAG TPA: acyl carrier protein [Leptolyngbyaceae cyanobacterium M33_DOE_097]|uniref:Acyl carrier protein n=1 Tax=Oscillatoriales cyanobacterium SpSt-418 TaxID=2282169 RepID=A0A7C3PHN7_9CYAN|nr:acyl carrier protein [Leptolyngbyaceae cyanobacterium M33_DOE_097]